MSDPANSHMPSPKSVLECFRLLVERESDLQPSSNFIMDEALIIRPGCGVTQEKRAILMQWILDVCDSYHLNQCTSCHVICLIDRTLERQPVKHHLALIGLACVLISSKFMEKPVKVTDLRRCAPTYTHTDILNKEKDVSLRMLYACYVYVRPCACMDVYRCFGLWTGSSTS